MGFGFNDPLPSCILQEGHEGDHLVQVTDGSFRFWLCDENYCDTNPDRCLCLGNDGFIECFSHRKADPEELLQLFQESPTLIQPLLIEGT